MFADAGYDAQQTYEAAAVNHPLRLEVVRRNPHAVGVEIIKRRWVVERTFSWFGRNRRLATRMLFLALRSRPSTRKAANNLGKLPERQSRRGGIWRGWPRPDVR